MARKVTAKTFKLQTCNLQQASQLFRPDLSVCELDGLERFGPGADSRAAPDSLMVVDANMGDLGRVIVVVVGGVHHRLTRCRVLESSLAMVLVRVEL